MKVLVTGATGMVGSELTRQLVLEGSDVRILRRDRSSLALLQEVEGDVEHAVGDIRDPSAVSRAMKGIAHVYHTAGFIGFSGRRDEAQLRSVNVDGTSIVVNAALRADVSRLVHTSSMAAFGRPDRPEGVIDEQSTWQPSRQNSRYARSKYEAELEVYRGVAEGLDAVIVNPSLIFGPTHPGENTRRIVERVCWGRLPASPSGGTNVVDVRDVARGHRLAMLNGVAGERYFLGSENLLWRDILTMLANAAGTRPPKRTVKSVAALGLAHASEAVAWLTRSRPLLTVETARTSSRFFRYSNAKAVTELNCDFRPFAETAAYLVEKICGQAVTKGAAPRTADSRATPP